MSFILKPHVLQFKHLKHEKGINRKGQVPTW